MRVLLRAAWLGSTLLYIVAIVAVGVTFCLFVCLFGCVGGWAGGGDFGNSVTPFFV